MTGKRLIGMLKLTAKFDQGKSSRAVVYYLYPCTIMEFCLLITLSVCQ